MITIDLLGPPRISRDGQPLAVTRRKSRALLYFLAAQPAPVSRERLIDLLWAGLARPAAQQTLRTTLHGLRQVLGESLVIADDTLALAPATDVDTRQIEALLSMATPDPLVLAAALERYRGDFLEGFSLTDAAAFDDWAAAAREQYQQLMLRGFATLARQHELRGERGAALAALGRALALDPLQEDLHRAAMRLQYLAGDRVGAIRRFEHLRARLDDELGVPPVAATRALYDAIVTDTLDPEPDTRGDHTIATPHPRVLPETGVPPALLVSLLSPLPFTGRAAELRTLRERMAAAQLVLIEGEPGIGKSRLAAEYLRESGQLVLAGAARELDQTLPYQPAIEALRGLPAQPGWQTLRTALLDPSNLAPVWAAEVSRLLPDFAPPGISPLPVQPADEARLREGLSQFLQAIGRFQPLVLFVDDLHWADAATLGLLGYLARRRLPGVGLLAATRPAEPRSALAALRQTLTREGQLGRLALSRLTPDDTATLARTLSPDGADLFGGWLRQNGEGNPYIIAELVRYAREHGLLRPDRSIDADALTAAPVVPASIYSLIQARLARLSDTARRVLDLAVAAGREFEVDVVARAAALSDASALDALEELHAHGLIVPRDERCYAFDHTLTMEVAYREVGEPRHRLLHRRLAEAIEQVHHRQIDTAAGLIAAHFIEGNAPERAVPYAFRAGGHAATLAAWDEAIVFYRQALAAADDQQRLDILMALGDAQTHAGSLPQASETLRAALELAIRRHDRASATAVRLKLANTLISQARFSEVVAVAEALVAADPDAAVQAELIWGTGLSVEGADLDGAAKHLRRASELCDARTDVATRAQISFDLGNVLAQQGDLPRAIERYRAALDIAAQSESALFLFVLAHNNLAYHLHLLRNPAARDFAERGLQIARERGLLNLQPFLYSTLGEIALAAGDLAAAERFFQEGLALAERLDAPERIAGLTANLGRVEARRNRETLAIHHFSTALAQADELGTLHLAAQIRLWLAPLLPPSQARAMLAAARAIAERGPRRLLLDEITRLEGR